jgi:hypothetical protein
MKKGLKYVVVVGPGYDFLTESFIYGCACLNIADLRWRNGYEWVCRDHLRLPLPSVSGVLNVDRAIKTISGIARFKLMAICRTSSSHMNWD